MKSKDHIKDEAKKWTYQRLNVFMESNVQFFLTYRHPFNYFIKSYILKTF